MTHDSAPQTGVKRLTVRNALGKIFSGLHFSRLKNRSWQTKLGIVLVMSSIASAFLTYAALNEAPPFGKDSSAVIWLLNLDLVLLLLLVTLIARRIIGVWANRRKGIAGSNLHVRLVYLFSVLVAVPTILVTVFSAFFFHFGIQAWFSQRVQTAIESSEAVAEAYLQEHKQVIRADTLAMANDLDRQFEIFLLNRKAFPDFIEKQAFYRNLSEAMVFKEDGEIIATSGLTLSLEYEAMPEFDLKQAEDGDVVLMTGANQDRVRALVKLRNYEGAYLLVGRMVDPQVLKHLTETKLAAEDYDDLQSKFSGLQITVTLIFVVVGLLVLLAAIWSGLLLARQLVEPISELIVAAEKVGQGDLSAVVPEEKSLEEFEYLARAFNIMTTQIGGQKDELLKANHEIDARRHLIETVLAGVSSGVIGASVPGVINLANTSALQLLGKTGEDITGHDLLSVLPEIGDALNEARQRFGKLSQVEIPIATQGMGKRSFLFRILAEPKTSDGIVNYILTFDDITELQSAQRKAAWSDVARRIAHEIKNPLTPIQLSAERLRRRYLKQITDDPDTFSECTDTIIKHVDDIGRMVDEFSAFARMPEPVLVPTDVLSIVKGSLVLPSQAHPNVKFEFSAEQNLKETNVLLDAVQIRQVMTNLVQNAVDALEGAQGQIVMLAGRHEDRIFVAITDSGKGFPQNIALEKLTDPYVTQKVKGTGLGLAIVKKIMEDHSGQLVLGVPDWLRENLTWKDLGGATVLLLFPSLSLDSNSGVKQVA